jgi:hypothetical protein
VRLILATRENQRVEAARLRSATKENIGTWSDLLQLPIVKAIRPANRWNADEGGLMDGQSENALTLSLPEGLQFEGADLLHGVYLRLGQVTTPSGYF